MSVFTYGVKIRPSLKILGNKTWNYLFNFLIIYILSSIIEKFFKLPATRRIKKMGGLMHSSTVKAAYFFFVGSVGGNTGICICLKLPEVKNTFLFGSVISNSEKGET